MYNHFNQYRCIIIRGKSQKEIDDLLSAYAKVIDDITPCETEVFSRKFNELLAPCLSADKRIKKTLDNHRTEIAGKLFGMYYVEENGYVYASDRTKKFLADNDQPAFFKDICYKMQFPNGMQKPQTFQPLLDNKISIRPNAFVLRVLQLAAAKHLVLTKKEIGYYILNSLDVLQGAAVPEEVIEAIERDRKDGVVRMIETEGKASSYNYQHINEQINYLELANLIYTNGAGEVWLNQNENEAIQIFASDWNKEPAFDVYSFDLSSVEGRKQFELEWTYYFGKLSDKAQKFETTANALGVADELPKKKKGTSGQTTVEIGDEGEAFVFEYEKNRVFKFNPRLVNRVLSLGKTKGLGYDIQSVVAEEGDKADFAKYIEVKSTKRVTEPNLSDACWMDTLNITRNEWIAAQQHGAFYCIYRVYFVRGRILMYVINNIHQKQVDKKVDIVPLTYRIDFGKDAIDRVVTEELEKDV
ncbi:MAG: DUF3883 domain-containing protein [Lachnospiraceae bacterium]